MEKLQTGQQVEPPAPVDHSPANFLTADIPLPVGTISGAKIAPFQIRCNLDPANGQNTTWVDYAPCDDKGNFQMSLSFSVEHPELHSTIQGLVPQALTEVQAMKQPEGAPVQFAAAKLSVANQDQQSVLKLLQ